MDFFFTKNKVYHDTFVHVFKKIEKKYPYVLKGIFILVHIFQIYVQNHFSFHKKIY
jgi:hypothetical protein